MKKILLVIVLLTGIGYSSFAQILSANPDTTVQGQNLTTTITMTAGQFSMGSPPYIQSDIYLQQGATIIYQYSGYNSWNNVYPSGDSLWTIFNIPGNAPLGYYDLHVVDYDQFMMPTDYVLPNAITVYPVAGTIEGDVYDDLNQNGIRDNGEGPLQNHRVLLTPGNISCYTDNNGHYTAYLVPGTYTVDYTPPWQYAQTSAPLTYTATVPPSYSGYDFGAYTQWVPQTGQDFYVWHHPMRCEPSYGFTYIDIKNNGTDTVQGSITMLISSNLSLNNAIPAPSISGDTLRWTYGPLYPGQTYHIGGSINNWISFFDPPAGQNIWYATVDSIFDLSGNFKTLYNDYFTFDVTCSCDPNDKWVYPEGVTAQHFTPPNTELTYTINFQNTGNDTAFTVSIVDTLDPNLDWNTFEIVSSTDPVYAQMDANGIVTFTFPNIMLPDSNVDEPGSHGAVAYQIMTDSLLPDPTTISNTAHIFFDWNPAVVTNTVMNTITALIAPVAAFTTGDVAICPGSCISFANQSTPAGSSYAWSFPGANPSSSTDPDPANICYTTSGSFDVQLIVSNALGTDTAVYPGYINVFTVAPQAISQSGDTLFANSGFVTYVWYYNGNIISGATNSYYVATQNGDYHVISFDVNGCDVEAAAFNVMTGIQHLQSAGAEIYPNPVTENMIVRNLRAQSVSVYNVLGEKILVVLPEKTAVSNEWSLDMSPLKAGIYTIELQSENQLYRTNFVKQ